MAKRVTQQTGTVPEHLTRERILDHARAAYSFPDGSRFPTAAEDAAEDARFEHLQRKLVRAVFRAAVEGDGGSLITDMQLARTKSECVEALAAFLCCCRFFPDFSIAARVQVAAVLLPMLVPKLHYKIEAGRPRAGHPHPFTRAVAQSFKDFSALAARLKDGRERLTRLGREYSAAQDGSLVQRADLSRESEQLQVQMEELGAIGNLSPWMDRTPAGGRKRAQRRKHWKAWTLMRPTLNLPRLEDWPERLDFEHRIVECAGRYLGVPKGEVQNFFGAQRFRKHWAKKYR